MGDMKSELQNNLEQNIDPCTQDVEECERIQKYLDRIEESFKIVDIIKEQLPNLFKNVLDYLATVEMPKVITEILKLVDKCMK